MTIATASPASPGPAVPAATEVTAREVADGPPDARCHRTLGVTSLAALAARVLVLTAASDGPHLPRRSPFERRHLGRIVTRAPLRRTLLGYLGHMWELYAGWALVGPLLVHVAGDGPTARILAFVVVAAGAVGVRWGGRVGDVAGRSRTARTAMLCSAGLVALLAVVHPSLPLAGIVAVAWGVAVIADGAMFPALAVDHAAPDEAGTVLTVQLALGFALTAVATGVVPLVQSAAGWTAALLVLAPGPLLGALALRHPDPR
jgi:predicted MFS family arabinose efflux permease